MILCEGTIAKMNFFKTEDDLERMDGQVDVWMDRQTDNDNYCLLIFYLQILCLSVATECLKNVATPTPVDFLK